MGEVPEEVPKQPEANIYDVLAPPDRQLNSKQKQARNKIISEYTNIMHWQRMNPHDMKANIEKGQLHLPSAESD